MVTPEPPGGSRVGARSARRYWAALGVVLLVGLGLRGSFPVSDPPWHATVGIVWHDEGAWLHNARNKALFGEWQLDQWNPMYLAPVFTAVEYGSFRMFGVGLWQARLVSVLFGIASVLCLAEAVRRTAGAHTGLAAGVLLATNYVWVMWNRVALLETMMVAFMVFAAAAYVAAHQPGKWRWGLAAGALAILAFFVKAAAAFFLVALAIEAAFAAHQSRERGEGVRLQSAGAATLIGLAAAGAVALAVFVVPHWSEFRFYNWQMSVTRKPEYTWRAILDRVTWLPVLHDFFTRMWALTLLALAGLFRLTGPSWRATPLERLCALWIGLGALELVLHDVGNERRLVFLIPPMVTLAALVVSRDRRLLPEGLDRLSLRSRLVLLPFAGACAYILAGSAVRLGFLYEVRPAVRLGALLATVALAVVFAAWSRLTARCARSSWTAAGGAALVAVMSVGDLAQYGQWMTQRTDVNYRAMVALRTLLPPDTRVQGKLANGLALESRIRPVFVGNGFGNYADRHARPDIKYALTYTLPRPAYEGRIMLEVLERRPWKVVQQFRVAETPTGQDAAALLEFTDATRGSALRPGASPAR